MTRLQVILSIAALTGTGCAAKQADTAEPAPVAAPAAPAVDPAIFEENDKDIAELATILPEFSKVTKSASEAATALQDAMKATSDLAATKNIKPKQIDKIVAESVKARKSKVRSIKKADNEAITAAVDDVVAKLDAFLATPQTIADTRQTVATLEARAKEIAERVRARTESLTTSSDLEIKQKADATLDHVAKVLEAVAGNVAAADAALGELATNVATMAKSLEVELNAGTQAPAPEAAPAAAAPAAAPAEPTPASPKP